MPEKVRAFLSYAHADNPHKTAFLMQFNSLIRTEDVSIWSDEQLIGGQVWSNVIEEQLSTSHLVICLVSPNFISSDYGYLKELELAISLKKSGKDLVIIPVLLSNCPLSGMPLAEYQTLPSDPRFIDQWPNSGDAWVNVIEGIRKQVRAIESNIKAWDPVSVRDNIFDLLRQSAKLEEACSQTIDFAVNYGETEHQFIAVTIRTKLDDLEYERGNNKNGIPPPTILEILNAKQQLRLDIYRLLKSIMDYLAYPSVKQII